MDLGRRGRGGRRVRQGLRRHRQQVGRRRDRRLRLDRPADHDQPHHRRRPDGRHPVQPRPPGRGAGRGRADARPDRRRDRGELGRRRRPRPSLLESCTLDGKIYCVPVNIHSWQWLWLSNKAFEDAGVPVPTNWDEFVAAAPKLREAGKIPLAMGGQPWQPSGAFNVLMLALGGKDLYMQGLRRQGRRGRRRTGGGEDLRRPPTRPARCREGSNVQDWNQATNMVITDAGRRPDHGRLGAGRVPGRGRGRRHRLHLPAGPRRATRSSRPTATPSTSRCSSDEEQSAAQEVLASSMFNPETQVAFNLKKGSLPIRRDVDLDAANDCMKKGLEILADGQHRRPVDRPADQPRHQHADRGPDDRVLQRHEHHARGRAGALRRDHRRAPTDGVADRAGRRTRAGGRPRDGPAGGRRRMAAQRVRASCSAT